MATSACGTLLHVEHADFDRVPGSKRAIAPRELSHSSCRIAFGSCGAIVGIERFENQPMIFGRRENRLRNHAAGRQRESCRQFCCDRRPAACRAGRRPAVDESASWPASAGKIGSSTRMAACSRANSASSAKGKVQVDGLQVGPAMSAAIEDAVERLVDDAVIVRPDHHLAVRVHPGVHGRRHQPAPSGSSIGIDSADAVVKSLGQGIEGPRPGRSS